MGKERGCVDEQIECSFETELRDGDAIFFRALPNEMSDKVMKDEEHEDFFFDHFWGFTGEHLHSERGFDVSEAQFDDPTLEKQLGEFFHWIGDGIQQGGHQGNILSAETRLGDAEAQDSNWESFRQGMEFIQGHLSGALDGSEPAKESVIFSEPLPSAEINGANAGEAENRIHLPFFELGDGGIGGKSPISEDDVPCLEEVPKELEKHGIMKGVCAGQIMEHDACGQGKYGDDLNHGKATPWLLA